MSGRTVRNWLWAGRDRVARSDRGVRAVAPLAAEVCRLEDRLLLSATGGSRPGDDFEPLAHLDIAALLETDDFAGDFAAFDGAALLGGDRTAVHRTRYEQPAVAVHGFGESDGSSRTFSVGYTLDYRFAAVDGHGGGAGWSVHEFLSLEWTVTDVWMPEAGGSFTTVTVGHHTWDFTAHGSVGVYGEGRGWVLKSSGHNDASTAGTVLFDPLGSAVPGEDAKFLPVTATVTADAATAFSKSNWFYNEDGRLTHGDGTAERYQNWLGGSSGSFRHDTLRDWNYHTVAPAYSVAPDDGTNDDGYGYEPPPRPSKFYTGGGTVDARAAGSSGSTTLGTITVRTILDADGRPTAPPDVVGEFHDHAWSTALATSDGGGHHSERPFDPEVDADPDDAQGVRTEWVNSDWTDDTHRDYFRTDVWSDGVFQVGDAGWTESRLLHDADGKAGWESNAHFARGNAPLIDFFPAAPVETIPAATASAALAVSATGTARVRRDVKVYTPPTRRVLTPEGRRQTAGQKAFETGWFHEGGTASWKDHAEVITRAESFAADGPGFVPDPRFAHVPGYPQNAGGLAAVEVTDGRTTTHFETETTVQADRLELVYQPPRLLSSRNGREHPRLTDHAESITTLVADGGATFSTVVTATPVAADGSRTGTYVSRGVTEDTVTFTDDTTLTHTEAEGVETPVTDLEEEDRPEPLIGAGPSLPGGWAQAVGVLDAEPDLYREYPPLADPDTPLPRDGREVGPLGRWSQAVSRDFIAVVTRTGGTWTDGLAVTLHADGTETVTGTTSATSTADADVTRTLTDSFRHRGRTLGESSDVDEQERYTKDLTRTVARADATLHAHSFDAASANLATTFHANGSAVTTSSEGVRGNGTVDYHSAGRATVDDRPAPFADTPDAAGNRHDPEAVELFRQKSWEVGTWHDVERHDRHTYDAGSTLVVTQPAGGVGAPTVTGEWHDRGTHGSRSTYGFHDWETGSRAGVYRSPHNGPYLTALEVDRHRRATGASGTGAGVDAGRPPEDDLADWDDSGELFADGSTRARYTAGGRSWAADHTSDTSAVVRSGMSEVQYQQRVIEDGTNEDGTVRYKTIPHDFRFRSESRSEHTVTTDSSFLAAWPTDVTVTTTPDVTHADGTVTPGTTSATGHDHLFQTLYTTWHAEGTERAGNGGVMLTGLNLDFLEVGETRDDQAQLVDYAGQTTDRRLIANGSGWRAALVTARGTVTSDGGTFGYNHNLLWTEHPDGTETLTGTETAFANDQQTVRASGLVEAATGVTSPYRSWNHLGQEIERNPQIPTWSTYTGEHETSTHAFGTWATITHTGIGEATRTGATAEARYATRQRDGGPVEGIDPADLHWVGTPAEAGWGGPAFLEGLWSLGADGEAPARPGPHDFGDDGRSAFEHEQQEGEEGDGDDESDLPGTADEHGPGWHCGCPPPFRDRPLGADAAADRRSLPPGRTADMTDEQWESFEAFRRRREQARERVQTSRGSRPKYPGLQPGRPSSFGNELAKELGRRFGNSAVGGASGVVGGAGSGLILGGTFGSVEPGLGTVAGAGAGALAGGAWGGVTGAFAGWFSDNPKDAVADGFGYGITGGAMGLFGGLPAPGVAGGGGTAQGAGSGAVGAGARRAVTNPPAVFDPKAYVGYPAVTPPHLPAGQYCALVINGRVYVARHHIDAFSLAGRKGADEFYGFAEIDAFGKVIRLFK